jgi:hypothetical protein
VKARWASGSIEAIKQTYAQLESVVRRASEAAHGAVRGGVQSDAAALVFDSPADAVLVGRRMFRLTFDEASAESRLWLRGLIVPIDAAEPLISELPLKDKSDFYVRHFSDSMLAAINVEQRFKGPRLLLAEGLVEKSLQDDLAIRVGEQFVVPLKKLTYAPGPDREVAGPWWDVLYLIPDAITPESLSETDRAVGFRLRWAARTEVEAGEEVQPGSSEELSQLSMLSVMWLESEAIAWSKLRRAGLAGPREEGDVAEPM